MSRRIELASGVDKALRRIDRAHRLRVVGAIELLALNRRPPGATLLRGEPRGLWRVRVGDYRIVYTIDDGALVVLVLRIGHRRDVYER